MNNLRYGVGKMSKSPCSIALMYLTLIFVLDSKSSKLISFEILRSLETVKKVYGSQDLKEGASSFVKKTDPKWQDK